MSTPAEPTSVRQGRHSISLVLRYGSRISTAVILLGLVLQVARAPAGPARSYHWSQAKLFLGDLARLEPSAVMAAGILLLLLTPVLRILTAAVSFAMEKDYKYVWISLGVLAIVTGSIIFSLVA